MQQQERGGSSEERKQQQDRRSKPMMQGGGGGGGGGGSEQQQPPPQKCPRCESLNTKFCYYNNYSLSQPRYFCKACRRYWTQGGTLRNVPVGGGCRKGKRTKTSTVAGGGETSQANNQHKPPTQQPHHPNLTSQQNFLSSIGPPVFRTKDDPTAGNLVAAHSSISSMGSYYYPTGGFLSSLAAIQPQSFNPHPLHQSLNIGGADDHHNNIGGSSNLGLLQGFSVPSFGSTQHQHSQQHHPQIYQMGNRENNSMNHPMYHNPSEESLIQSGRPGNSYQGFINNTNNPNVPDTTAAMWSISSTSSGNTNSNTNIGSASGSLSPNQWPDLPGYGPSP